MKIILQLLILPFILLSFIVSAQVKTNFNNPASITEKGRFAKPYKIQVDFEVAAKDIAALLKLEKDEVAKSKETKAFQLAVPVLVDLDIAKLINWNYDSDFSYGKFTIKLNGALSSSINFDQFYLPNGTEMYIYNENGGMITGAITDNENNSNKIWGSWVYKGQFITIEIKTPLVSVKQLLLHSNNIAYGYKEVYKTKVADFGTSGTCEINVLCPLGNGWEAERNSVALILSDNGGSWCSGAMIMNTCSTSRPFFLTANHCLTGQNVAAWRFTFQAWSPTCNPSQNAIGVTYNGSTLRANWGNSDFCLVELNNTPPVNSGINYAGWTISNVPAQNATGIHHPHGDVMKISRANNAVARIGYGGVAGNDHWQANWSLQNNGAGQLVTAVTEGGSSGSPLFDQNHRIIGQLHGGPSVCGGAQLWDYYGSFDVSWTGGGTNATRLSDWLDPSSLGTMTTTTTNISALNVQQTLSAVNGPTVFCTSGTYTTNLQAGTNVTWSVTQPGSTLSCTNCSQTTLTMSSAGSEWITASFGCPTQTVTLQVKSANYTTYSNFNTMGPHVFCKNQTATISVDQTAYPGLSNFIWGPIPTGWTKITGGTGNNYVVIKAPNSTSPPTFNFPVSATTICGTSSTVNHFLAISNCTSMRISPNPTSDVITIEEYDDNTGKLVTESNIKAIEIINKMGLVNYRHQYKNNFIGSKLTIPVRLFNNDLYNVRIYDGIGWKSYKVIVRH